MDFQAFRETYKLRLDNQQEAAVRAEGNAVLLLAVPGSGKTTVLVSRIGYLLHVKGVPPREILTMTYTVAATRDMRTRYAAYFGEEEAEQLAFRTINGVCSRILYHYQRLTGRTAFSLLSDLGQQSALLAAIYRQQTGDYAGESTVRALQTAITYAKNQMLSNQELEKQKVEGAAFAPIFRAYCAEMERRRLMDYDDQMVYALRILRRYPQIRAAIQSQYRHYLVDEAQDTSKIQHEILRLLAQGAESVFMVGDEDQSIYGFRAAYPQALTEFEASYPGAKVLYLEQNYRSAAEIVAVADRFIQKNTSRRPKHLKATRGSGAMLRAVEVYDRRRQALYLAKVAEDPGMETAVLYRDNESALPLIDRLSRSGTPYRTRPMDGSFFSSRVVRDIVDMLRFSLDPTDGELFLNFYYKLGAGISRQLAQRAASQREEPVLSFLAGLDETPPYTRRQCRALNTHFTHLREEAADRAVYRLVHFMGYGDYLQAHGMDMGKAEIMEILGAQEPTVLQFLHRLEELEEIARAGGGLEGIVLSTIHASKGLEYERVILMDVADGIFPRSVPAARRRDEAWESYEEERRLFYVAMTRAKQELWIMKLTKDSLASSFTEEVFSKRKEEKRRRLPAEAKKKPPAPPAELFQVGKAVRHETFGRGVMKQRRGDVVVIQFDGGEERWFSLSLALKLGQLLLE